jgi:hypothetical protein
VQSYPNGEGPQSADAESGPIRYRIDGTRISQVSAAVARSGFRDDPAQSTVCGSSRRNDPLLQPAVMFVPFSQIARGEST